MQPYRDFELFQDPAGSLQLALMALKGANEQQRMVKFTQSNTKYIIHNKTGGGIERALDHLQKNTKKIEESWPAQTRCWSCKLISQDAR